MGSAQPDPNPVLTPILFPHFFKVISKEKDKCDGLLQSTLAGYTNLGYYRGETRAEIEKIINKTGSFR